MDNLKTWGDLARNYSLVLFNEAPNMGNGEVLEEYIESHTPNGDFDEFEQLRKDDANFAEQYGADEFEDWQRDNDSIEVYQWYAIEINEFDVKYLNEKYNLDIFYSDFLGIYILPVTHFGTSWDILNLAGGYADQK